MTPTSRRAVSLAELVIAALVLAVGLVPIVGSIQSSAREARQLEAHAQGLARCRGLLEAVRVWGPAAFERALGGGASAEAPLPIDLPTDFTPPAAAGVPPGVASPVLSRMPALAERVTVRLVRRNAGGAGLYALRAVVSWRSPGDGNRTITAELVTLAGDPRASLVGGAP